MNQQLNAISLAHVLASSLVGESQVWNLVKHRLGCKISLLIDHFTLSSGDKVFQAPKQVKDK